MVLRQSRFKQRGSLVFESLPGKQSGSQGHLQIFAATDGPPSLQAAETELLCSRAARMLHEAGPAMLTPFDAVVAVADLQDEGACWAPTAIWPSIMLTHWGRKVCTEMGTAKLS